MSPCVCSFNENVNLSNILSISAAVLQVMLYPKLYSLLGEGNNNNMKEFTKMFLILLIILSVGIIIYGIILTVKGTKESIDLRNSFCNNKQLPKNSGEKCNELPQSIFNYINIFNNSLGFLMFIVIFIYLLKAKNMTDKLSYILYAFLFLGLSVGSIYMKPQLLIK
jgi:hypothetical protein